MAKVFQCDRCHEVYSEIPKTKTGVRLYKFNPRTGDPKTYRNPDNEGGRWLDLCSFCQADLETFAVARGAPMKSEGEE